MIERQEIDQVAAHLSVKRIDVERDYVNGWLLSGIARSPLRELLILKGGNALRKAYFENTRYSKDLDFSTPGSINHEALRSCVEEACAYVSERTGVEFARERLIVNEKQRVSNNLEVLEVRAYFFGFAGERQNVQLRVYMDVTQYDKLLLPPVERRILHGYSDAAACQGLIRCMALEEILATKLKCLLQRRHVADLFDYLRWILFDDAPIDRGKLLNAFLQKTIYDRAPGIALELLLSLPFAIMEELWDRYITCPTSCRIAFTEGVLRFREHLGSLFGHRAHDRGYELSFFTPAYRERILSAGRSRHLMRAVYDGSERVVEPYSLKFRERKDGGGGEYFFVHQRSGGSGIGLRQYVAEKMSALEELDESFEPRYEIEVAKAGDEPEDVHFHGRGGPAFVPGFGGPQRERRRVRSSVSEPKHRVRCSECGRLFARKNFDLQLKPHTRPDGDRCWGAWGTHEGWR